jgi:hypothetical protein
VRDDEFFRFRKEGKKRFLYLYSIPLGFWIFIRNNPSRPCRQIFCRGNSKMAEASGVLLTSESLFVPQSQNEFDSFLQMLKENETVEFPFIELSKDFNPETSSKLEVQPEQIPPEFLLPQQYFQPDQFVKAEPLSSSPSSGPAIEEKDYMSYVSSNIVPNFAEQKTQG